MRPPHLLVFTIALVSANVAYGYIDPGPTNLIIQFLIAMGASSLFFMKRIWSTLSARLSKNKPKVQVPYAQPTKNKGKRPKKAA